MDAWFVGGRARRRCLAASMRGYAESLQRMGLRPRYITPEQLASGPPSDTALILPRAIALSPAEVASIEAFARRGGQVIADAAPGQFDDHGRRLPSPQIAIPLTAPEIWPMR